jgi:hypothetical protein
MNWFCITLNCCLAGLEMDLKIKVVASLDFLVRAKPICGKDHGATSVSQPRRSGVIRWEG